jgi:hypothetical protein
MLQRRLPFSRAAVAIDAKGLRCCLFLQSHAQLKSLYPFEHEAITENCGARVAPEQRKHLGKCAALPGRVDAPANGASRGRRCNVGQLSACRIPLACGNVRRCAVNQGESFRI